MKTKKKKPAKKPSPEHQEFARIRRERKDWHQTLAKAASKGDLATLVRMPFPSWATMADTMRRLEAIQSIL